MAETIYNIKTKTWVAEKPKEIKLKDVEAIVGKVEMTLSPELLIIKKNLSAQEKLDIEALT